MLLSPENARAFYRFAVENRFAALAVNADSPAAVVDCLIAAKERDAPIIIETSLWQLKGHSFGVGDPYLGVVRYLADLRILADSERFRDVPIIYHTDHIKGPETIRILKHAMESGASSISLDSSELDHETNISYMSELCQYAIERDLEASLEMEAGVDDGVTPLEETKKLFGEVERRHPGYLSLWAPGVGTKHGLSSEMEGFSPVAVKEHQALASDIAGRPIGIALHGSSGLSNEQLEAAVGAGVAKVNWSSESLLIRSAAAKAYFADNAEKLTKGHGQFKAAAMDNGLQDFISEQYTPRVEERISILGGAGKGKEFLESLS